MNKQKSSTKQSKRSLVDSRDFIRGAKDGIPICLGYFSVSMAFGLTAVLSGMPLWSAVAISITNVTSAGQFAGTNILLAGGTMTELVLTSLIINIRYFLMSLSVSQKLNPNLKMKQRLAIAYGITDEIFAVSVRRKGDLSGSYMFGLILIPVIGWAGGTLFGAVAASYMPQSLTNAMGIALYGMFIAIIIGPAREEKSVMITVIMAIAASLGFAYLPVLNKISGGWSIIIITVAVSMIAAWLFPIKEEEETGDVPESKVQDSDAIEQNEEAVV